MALSESAVGRSQRLRVIVAVALRTADNDERLLLAQELEHARRKLNKELQRIPTAFTPCRYYQEIVKEIDQVVALRISVLK